MKITKECFGHGLGKTCAVIVDNCGLYHTARRDGKKYYNRCGDESSGGYFSGLASTIVYYDYQKQSWQVSSE